MLQINPYFRPSATECLKSSVFDQIRCKDMEKSAKEKIKLDVDADEAFDYENSKSMKYSIKDYISIIRKTSDEIHASRVEQLK